MDTLIRILKDPMRVVILLVVTAIVGGFFYFIFSRGTTNDMALLFSGMEPAESARLVSKIESMDIPVQVKGDGGQIFVPSDKVARLRLELAKDGVIGGGGLGFELFDKSDALGVSNALMDINYVRALEGELAKSIKTIASVGFARVHLVMPKRELFGRDKSEPSASIMLKMKSAGSLSHQQVKAIQYLVGSAVPGLSVEKIAIIDDRGLLLAKSQSGHDGMQGLTQQQEIQTSYESKLSKSIESLLDKTLGPGKSSAEVTVDLDFNRVTMNSEDFNPDRQVVRSTVTSTESADSKEGAGQGVSVQNALPDQQGAGGEGGAGNKSNRNEETVNYEIAKTHKTEVKETGVVRRISVAVLVDGQTEVGSDGKSAYKPRTKEELEQLTGLVKSAIGFKEDRGDKVELVNMRFTMPEALKEAEVKEPGFFDKINIAKTLEMIMICLVGFMILLMVVRPLAMKALEGLPQEQKVEAAMGGVTAMAIEGPGATGQMAALPEPESMIDIANIEGRVKASSVRKIEEIVDRHTDEAVSIIRSWMTPGA